MRASRGALMATLLSAGQDVESIAEVFAAVDVATGSSGGIASPDERITRDQWRQAVAAASRPATAPGAADSDETDPSDLMLAEDSSPPDDGGASGPGAAGSAGNAPTRRRLFVEGIDTLTLYIGCLLYCQSLLLQREHAAATPVLRELINIAPPLLRATYEGWGYSRGYCTLEQLWLEAYAGVVSASLHARDTPTRTEGLAMAIQLISMIQVRDLPPSRPISPNLPLPMPNLRLSRVPRAPLVPSSAQG